ncbi:MAG: serine hydrolase [bacterium]
MLSIIRKFLIYVLLFLTSNTALAFSPARLEQILLPYKGKVGLAFVDLNTGYTFHVNGSNKYPAASVAKVPVMATAYYLADQGKLDLDAKVTLRQSDKLGGSGVLQWRKPGQRYTLRNLIRMMISLSDNTATRMIVNVIGTPEINSYIRSAGLENTIVADPTMLKAPPGPGNNRTSPLDMAKLIAKINDGVSFYPASAQEMLGFMKNQRYRWGIWRGVPKNIVVADKTGNLDGVLNDAGIVYTKPGNYILSVFTYDFKKQRDARQVINALSTAAYEEYTGEKVPKPKVKKITYKKKKITKRRSPRRPSVKLKRRTGQSVRASSRK